MSVLYQLSDRAQPGVVRGYLMGTIHLYHRSFDRWLQLANTYLQQCDLFCPEMDINGLDDDIRQKFNEMPPAAIRISKNQSAFFLRHFGLDLQKLKGIPSTALFGLLFSRVTDGITTAGSVDQFLLEQATTLGIRVKGLESVSTQLDIMAGIQDASLTRQLSSLIKRPLQMRKQTAGLIDLYARGEILRMYKAGQRQSGKDRKILIYDRNIKMAATLSSLLEAHPGSRIFAAVGCGHLPGRTGMLRLLKQNGFISSPLLP